MCEAISIEESLSLALPPGLRRRSQAVTRASSTRINVWASVKAFTRGAAGTLDHLLSSIEPRPAAQTRGDYSLFTLFEPFQPCEQSGAEADWLIDAM